MYILAKHKIVALISGFWGAQSTWAWNIWIIPLSTSFVFIYLWFGFFFFLFIETNPSFLGKKIPTNCIPSKVLWQISMIFVNYGFLEYLFSCLFFKNIVVKKLLYMHFRESEKCGEVKMKFWSIFIDTHLNTFFYHLTSQFMHLTIESASSYVMLSMVETFPIYYIYMLYM